MGIHRRRSAGRGQRIPEARVVQGGHAPSWGQGPWKPAPASPSATTYERVSIGRESLFTMVLGFWPLIAILSVGIAMVWSASVFNGP